MTDPIHGVSAVEKPEFVLPIYGEYFNKIDIHNQTVYLEKNIEQYDNEDIDSQYRILVTPDYMAFLTSTKRNVWDINEKSLDVLIQQAEILSEEFINSDSEDSFRDLKKEEDDIQIEITPIADDYETRQLLETQISHRLYS